MSNGYFSLLVLFPEGNSLSVSEETIQVISKRYENANERVIICGAFHRKMSACLPSPLIPTGTNMVGLAFIDNMPLIKDWK